MSAQRADSRRTLAFSDLKVFAKWATKNGFKKEPTPEDARHEVLRLRPVAGGAPILFFRQDGWRNYGGATYVTTTKIGTELAKRWHEERVK
jgi:hypothetical protein